MEEEMSGKQRLGSYVVKKKRGESSFPPHLPRFSMTHVARGRLNVILSEDFLSFVIVCGQLVKRIVMDMLDTPLHTAYTCTTTY